MNIKMLLFIIIIGIIFYVVFSAPGGSEIVTNFKHNFGITQYGR